MFQMPTSSDMIMTMLGFLSAAWAGLRAQTSAAVPASSDKPMCLSFNCMRLYLTTFLCSACLLMSDHRSLIAEYGFPFTAGWLRFLHCNRHRLSSAEYNLIADAVPGHIHVRANLKGMAGSVRKQEDGFAVLYINGFDFSGDLLGIRHQGAGFRSEEHTS